MAINQQTKTKKLVLGGPRGIETLMHCCRAFKTVQSLWGLLRGFFGKLVAELLWAQQSCSLVYTLAQTT